MSDSPLLTAAESIVDLLESNPPAQSPRLDQLASRVAALSNRTTGTAVEVVRDAVDEPPSATASSSNSRSAAGEKKYRVHPVDADVDADADAADADAVTPLQRETRLVVNEDETKSEERISLGGGCAAAGAAPMISLANVSGPIAPRRQSSSKKMLDVVAQTPLLGNVHVGSADLQAAPSSMQIASRITRLSVATKDRIEARRKTESEVGLGALDEGGASDSDRQAVSGRPREQTSSRKMGMLRTFSTNENHIDWADEEEVRACRPARGVVFFLEHAHNARRGAHAMRAGARRQHGIIASPLTPCARGTRVSPAAEHRSDGYSVSSTTRTIRSCRPTSSNPRSSSSDSITPRTPRSASRCLRCARAAIAAARSSFLGGLVRRRHDGVVAV